METAQSPFCYSLIRMLVLFEEIIGLNLVWDSDRLLFVISLRSLGASWSLPMKVLTWNDCLGMDLRGFRASYFRENFWVDCLLIYSWSFDEIRRLLDDLLLLILRWMVLDVHYEPSPAALTLLYSAYCNCLEKAIVLFFGEFLFLIPDGPTVADAITYFFKVFACKSFVDDLPCFFGTIAVCILFVYVLAVAQPFPAAAAAVGEAFEICYSKLGFWSDLCYLNSVSDASFYII